RRLVASSTASRPIHGRGDSLHHLNISESPFVPELPSDCRPVPKGRRHDPWSIDEGFDSTYSNAAAQGDTQTAARSAEFADSCVDHPSAATASSKGKPMLGVEQGERP